MKSGTRDGWADLAKGVCIVLVVLWHVSTKHVQQIDWGHAEGIASLWTLLSAQFLPLRMPLFFFVSGVFAARAVFASDHARAGLRAARLLGLYVLWLTIQTFVLAAVAPDFDTARAHTVAEFLAELTVSPTNLWYLLALGLYLLLGRATRDMATSAVLIVAFVVSSIAATGVLPDWGNLWQVFQNPFFFLLGLRLNHQLSRVAGSANAWKAALTGMGLIAALAVVTALGIRHAFGVWPVLCLLAVHVGITVCAVIDRWMPRATTPLCWIGQRTLPIYVIHMIPLAILDRVLRGPDAAAILATPLMAIIEPVLLATVVIAICLATHGLTSRLYHGVLFDPIVLFRRTSTSTR